MGKLEKLNPLFWLKKLNQKFIEFEQMGYSGIFELATDLQNENSKLHCQKCKTIMPMMKAIVIAKSYKNGEPYKVKCRKCGYDNILIKGEW